MRNSIEFQPGLQWRIVLYIILSRSEQPSTKGVASPACSRSTLRAIEPTRVGQKQFRTPCEEINRLLREKKEEIFSLRDRLHFQKMETEKVKKSWKAEQDQFNEMKPSFDKAATQLNEEWEVRWIVRQRETAAELETLQRGCEKKVSQVIQDKDDLITSVRKGVMALEEGKRGQAESKGDGYTTSADHSQMNNNLLDYDIYFRFSLSEKILNYMLSLPFQELALKTDKEKAKMTTGKMFRILTLFSECK